MKTLDIHKNGKPCIYMIRNNVSNKIYIGSAIGHYRRKGQHFYMLRRNSHFNLHLQSSWNKYGESNFIFKVLEFVENLDNLQEREEFWIKTFNSTNPSYGYNSRTNCKTNLNLKWPEESKFRFSEKKKGIPLLHINYSEVAQSNNKKVVGIDIITGEEINFDSVLKAAKYFNIHQSVISKAANKKIKTSKGYIWDFVEKSTSNNSVNSGEVLRDNPDPSVVNDITVTTKEQRLIGEESTNNPNTSAEQPMIFHNFGLNSKGQLIKIH
ncbi:MAG: GIY-YIG nuclease family protein [Methanogenium sp.]